MTEAFEIGVSLALRDGVSDSILHAQRNVAALERAVAASGVSVRALRDAGVEAASVPRGTQIRDMHGKSLGDTTPAAALQDATRSAGKASAAGSPRAADGGDALQTQAGAVAAVMAVAPDMVMASTTKARSDAFRSSGPAGGTDRAGTVGGVESHGRTAPALAGLAGFARDSATAPMLSDTLALAEARDESSIQTSGALVGCKEAGCQRMAEASDAARSRRTATAISIYGAEALRQPATPFWRHADEAASGTPPVAVWGKFGNGEDGGSDDNPARDELTASIGAVPMTRAATRSAARQRAEVQGGGDAQAQQGQPAQIAGDVYLDGMLVGRWISQLLRREAARAPAGPSGFDPKRGQLLPGVTVGG